VSRARTSGLVVPIEAAEPLVEAWVDLLPASSRELPPHITVLWPFLAPEALDARVERDLEALFSGVAPFGFALARVGGFPDVVFLAPEPPEPFVGLTRLVWQRWPECPPFGGAYADVVPHLTVALDPAPSTRRAVEDELARRLPAPARAECVLLVEEAEDGVLRERRRFALGGAIGESDRT